VIAPAHGVLVTSATLTDPTLADPFALAEMRTGAARLPERPKTLKVASPFDYASQARAFVVTDVGREDPRQVAAALRELFLAAGGGGLGLFTAIRRLRAVHERLAAPLADKGIALYAQHVDPLEVGALVDIFRAEEDACLLGTDAVRDGVDVPGARCGCWSSTASRGRGPTSCTRPGGPGSAARATTTRWRAPASPRRSAG